MKPLQNVRKVLGTLKHRKPTQIYCPRCTSPNIQLSSSFDTWLFPTQYRCNSCGYTGPIVLELDKLEKNEKERENENSS